MTNRAIIGLGSNIAPLKNIPEALSSLKKHFRVIKESKFVLTKPIGPVQPEFTNGAALIETEFDLSETIKVLKNIEIQLGRDPTHDRFGPRTIDLDVIIWNGKVIDKDFYDRDFLKLSVSELVPDQ